MANGEFEPPTSTIVSHKYCVFNHSCSRIYTFSHHMGVFWISPTKIEASTNDVMKDNKMQIVFVLKIFLLSTNSTL